MFKKVNPKQSFPKLETEILAGWEEKNVFEQSILNRSKNKSFSFYDGPPFATGTPHYGHLLAGTIKDVIPRFKTMQGYRVERIWGWDTHGLPIENIVEQELDIKTKDQVVKLGIDKFNELCRTKVLTYADEWKKVVAKTGRWVNMEDAYLTMNPEFMESVWWVFSELYKKELAYEGHKVMPYCPRCATPLSNFEVGQGYKDKRDKAVTVKFELENEPNTFLLAWTTTPWTLPGNLALSVGTDIEYTKVLSGDKKYILATARLENYANELGKYSVISTHFGKELVGIKYIPVFDFYKNPKKAFIVIDGEHVTTEDGTGIVHTAPAFGEADNIVARKHGIDFFMPVDDLGNFTIDVPDYSGKSVITLETNEQIITDLGSKVFRVDGITHSYPHCWRCDSPLIYRGVSSWFVSIESIKSKMLENNKMIYWLPDSVGHNRFAKLIESAPDWSISRNRFWGTPIPVWKCADCGKVEVLGSVAELEAKSSLRVSDIHLHKISGISWGCDCGSQMEISGEVFDCWFESGSMPYGSIHYPFENKDKFTKDFPADFIAEGIDQTRGWFYSLLAISTALFGKSSYKSVIVNGTILAEDGFKMAKKLQNYPDPMHIVNTYGADAMRFSLMSSPAVKAEDFRFSERGVDEVVKKVILTLWNSYGFFTTYAEIDGFKPTGKLDTEHPMDFWIISELNKLITNTTESFEKYDLSKVARLLSEFTDDLSNWYIRRSRRRFWKSENDSEKFAAYETLYHVLVTYSKLIAPFMPFVADSIYQNLVLPVDDKAPVSVHLTDWPISNKKIIDEVVNKQVHLARNIVEMGLKLRASAGVNVRQPLGRLTVVSALDSDFMSEITDSIKEELNVAEVAFANAKSNIKDIEISSMAKLDFRAAGPRLGSKVKEVQNALSKGDYTVDPLERVLAAGETLEPSEVNLGISVVVNNKQLLQEAYGDLAVVLDITITGELQNEGYARELVRKIQDGRKEAGYEVSDRIILSLSGSKDSLPKSITDYVVKETLTSQIYFEELEVFDFGSEVKLGDDIINIKIRKD